MKTVRMVAEIVAERCTGCALCVYVCPTVALTLRDRRADEAGTHRRIVELAEPDCYCRPLGGPRTSLMMMPRRTSSSR